MSDMGCEFFGYLNYSVYFHTVSYGTVPSLTWNTTIGSFFYLSMYLTVYLFIYLTIFLLYTHPLFSQC